MKKIDCTGNACKGDYVYFKRAIFSGSYPNSTFEGMEDIEGEIIKDSYGKDKQQHTFTILPPTGVKIRIKGRNLYRNGCERREWDNEEDRNTSLNEKYRRGNKAREDKKVRETNIY